MMSSRRAASLRLPTAFILILGTLALSGCITGGPRLVTPETPSVPEGGADVPSDGSIVLTDGNQVVASTAAGKMKIEAGPGLRRVFNWDGLRRGAIIKPRSESFAGGDHTGITFDGKPTVWADAKGIDQLRYEEGRRDFATVDDALIWMQIRRLYYTWNDDGLVVGWRRQGHTLHVELWQFYIDGKKPKSLPDSHDADITEDKLVVEPQKMYPHLVFGDGHTEPYNTDTASKYKGAGRTSASAAASDDNGAPAEQGNWFQLNIVNPIKRAFGMDDKPAATDDAGAGDNGDDATADQSRPAGSADDNDAADTATEPDASANDAKTADKPDGRPADDKNNETDKANKTSSDADSAAVDQAATDAPRASIARSVVNIRSRPSTNSDVLLKANKGDSVVILKEDRGWRYVRFEDGRKGWVADFLLKH